MMLESDVQVMHTYIILVLIFSCTHIVLPETNCTAGSIRLVGGNTPEEGRVQICFNNHWGEICPLSFTTQDALVVCRQLGLPTVGAYFTTGFGKGDILTVNFTTAYGCRGDEASLLNCSFSITPSCSLFTYHAGVHCESKMIVAYND